MNGIGMIRRLGVLLVAAIWLAAPLARGETYRFPLDQQINVGRGDVIFPTAPKVTFESEPSGGFARFHLTAGNGQGQYYWGPSLYLPNAGITSLDLTHPDSIVEFDARYYQDLATNTNPYGDAPVFCILTDTSFRRVATHAYYWSTYEWQHVAFHPASYGPWYWGDAAFDLSRVGMIGFYGTDWYGTGNDYVDFRNVTITAVPEIDPAGIGSVMALVSGALALLERRKRLA